jgi:hypothetical protein
MRVVLPRIDAADESEWRNVTELLEETRAVGVYCTEALPYLLLRRPGELTSVTNAIGNDLNSDIEDAVDAAAGALRQWFRLSAAGSIQPPPPPLLQAIVERVIFRRNPGVGRCLVELAFLIADMPAAIDASQFELLTASLVAWERATRLQTMDDDRIGEFHIAERPGLQVRVAMLARALMSRHARFGGASPMPAPLQLWRDLCSSSRLPEVRRAFKPAEEFSPSAPSLDCYHPINAKASEPVALQGETSGDCGEAPPNPTVH